VTDRNVGPVRGRMTAIRTRSYTDLNDSHRLREFWSGGVEVGYLQKYCRRESTQGVRNR
jgi:hypothetical protein